VRRWQEIEEFKKKRETVQKRIKKRLKIQRNKEKISVFAALYYAASSTWYGIQIIDVCVVKSTV
jgi:ubiquinone biosynthesis protein COQ9